MNGHHEQQTSAAQELYHLRQAMHHREQKIRKLEPINYDYAQFSNDNNFKAPMAPSYARPSNAGYGCEISPYNRNEDYNLHYSNGGPTMVDSQYGNRDASYDEFAFNQHNYDASPSFASYEHYHPRHEHHEYQQDQYQQLYTHSLTPPQPNMQPNMPPHLQGHIQGQQQVQQQKHHNQPTFNRHNDLKPNGEREFRKMYDVDIALGGKRKGQKACTACETTVVKSWRQLNGIWYCRKCHNLALKEEINRSVECGDKKSCSTCAGWKCIRWYRNPESKNLFICGKCYEKVRREKRRSTAIAA